jgi:dihydrofolate reductase
MKKIIMFNRVSMDGFFAGPNGESHEWFITDPEVDKAAHEMMEPDTVLFGRVTYQIFENHWPKAEKDPKASKEAGATAKELKEMNKLVFSRTLNKVNWENSKLIKGNLTEEVRKLKQGSGPDIVIFGSGTIVQQLSAEGLMDEYLFVVTPVILGAGKSLFKDVKKLDLKLLETRVFKSGNVLLHYKAKNKVAKDYDKKRKASSLEVVY